LELATVSILRQDSSLISYQLSNKDGLFSFEKLPLKKKLLVNVTYSGYIAYRSMLELTAGKTDTLAVHLLVNPSDTNAIVITTTAPVRMNGDTLELNPAAFKLKDDAVVEELLNQVAGITIWSDGTITVNGRKVQTLLVDGKPFMGSTDTRVATQNLPKAAIEKIQLYQEYDRSNINQQIQPQDSLLTMNIKLKETSKKGYFGKAGAGYGTTGRFESDLSFQLYNKKSSIGIGGGFNNINKSIENLQELFQNNTYRNYNPNLYSVGRFGANGINRNHSVGAVATHNFIESANSRQNNRVTVNYNTSGTDTYLTDLTLQDRTTLQNPQFIREMGVQNNRGYRHDAGLNYVKTNSYNDNLNVRGSITSSWDKGRGNRNTEVRDLAGGLQSTNNIATLQSRRSNNAQGDVRYAKSDGDDPLKSFSLQVSARTGKSESERTVNSFFESFTDRSKNAGFNRRYSSANDMMSATANLDYAGFKRFLLGRYNLFGINLHFSQSITYNRNTANTRVDDYDSTNRKYNVNSSLTNRNQRELLEYAPTLSFSKGFNKWSESFHQNFNIQVRLTEDIKTEKNGSSLLKRNIDRSFRFFRYGGNANFQRVKREKYQFFSSLNYSKNFDFPSVDQLLTIVDDINAYEIRIGNPNLRNQVQHNLNLNANFNTQNPKSAYSINSNINGGYNLALNPITDSVINDLSGKRISYYINANQRRNLNLNYNFNISRRLKKNSLQLQYNGSIGNGWVPNYIDGVYNTSETGNLSNSYSLQFSVGSLLVLNLGQSFQQYQTRQSAAGLRSFKNSSNSSKLGVVVNYPVNFTFSSTVDHILNSNLDKPTVLWNAFATYRFMKQQGELKLAAMDILKQYQNISNSANAFGTTTRVTNGLQQYFLLTFSYYPRNFGRTAIKKPS
ncbi:MAG: outer membrane beta-barrel family protein, partial [Bacteroidota bacterium]|nr:outer membrane beta-barrel family protein [Bacteroidota bacterium]